MVRSFYIVLAFLLIGMGVQAQENETFKEREYTPVAQKFEQFIHDAYGDRADDLVFNDQIRRLILQEFFTDRLTIVERNPEIPIPEWFPNLSQLGEMPYVSAPTYSSNMNPLDFNPFYFVIDYQNTSEIQMIRITGTHFYLRVKPFKPEVINELR